MASRPQKPFEFPDGYNNLFGVERYRFPEIMFQPQQFLRVVSCVCARAQKETAMILMIGIDSLGCQMDHLIHRSLV